MGEGPARRKGARGQLQRHRRRPAQDRGAHGRRHVAVARAIRAVERLRPARRHRAARPQRPLRTPPSDGRARTPTAWPSRARCARCWASGGSTSRRCRRSSDERPGEGARRLNLAHATRRARDAGREGDARDGDLPGRGRRRHAGVPDAAGPDGRSPGDVAVRERRDPPARRAAVDHAGLARLRRGRHRATRGSRRARPGRPPDDRVVRARRSAGATGRCDDDEGRSGRDAKRARRGAGRAGSGRAGAAARRGAAAVQRDRRRCAWPGSTACPWRGWRRGRASFCPRCCTDTTCCSGGASSATRGSRRRPPSCRDGPTWAARTRARAEGRQRGAREGRPPVWTRA